MSDKARRDWSSNERRLSESDDNAAIAFGRDLIKFGQWLNGGAIAALPIIAGAIDLKGSALVNAFGVPAVFFVSGLVCSVLSTLFAFLALASRSDARLAVSDAVAIDDTFSDPSRQWTEQLVSKAVADAQKLREENRLLHRRFLWWRVGALGFAFLSVGSFVVGVAIASMRLLA